MQIFSCIHESKVLQLPFFFYDGHFVLSEPQICPFSSFVSQLTPIFSTQKFPQNFTWWSMNETQCVGVYFMLFHDTSYIKHSHLTLKHSRTSKRSSICLNLPIRQVVNKPNKNARLLHTSRAKILWRTWNVFRSYKSFSRIIHILQRKKCNATISALTPEVVWSLLFTLARIKLICMKI